MKQIYFLMVLLILSASMAKGQVSINTDSSAPDSSAILDLKSTAKGFLPPRMTTVQRNTIALPVEGLVIYNTDEKALNVYNGMVWNSMAPIPAFGCGLTISINHVVSGGVAPVNKTVAYGTVNGIPGEITKCWITSNLGSDHQATAVDDASEASAGWYWQFNHKQGYKHDGLTRTPNTTWINSIYEGSDWMTGNDPCSIELGTLWHIPTYTEWHDVLISGGWTSLTDPWNSGLKLHAAGFLDYSVGSLNQCGSGGYYWSSTQVGGLYGWGLYLENWGIDMYNSNRAYGFSVRCVRD
jgi:uncharacterized protein (TIGR02145 family)